MAKNQAQNMNNVMGWLIALALPIAMVIITIIPFLAGKCPFDILFCLLDRQNLKQQAVWKKGPIAWGWCIISPVYLYKRTILLKEPMTKFWIATILYTIVMLVAMLYVLALFNM